MSWTFFKDSQRYKSLTYVNNVPAPLTYPSRWKSIINTNEEVQFFKWVSRRKISIEKSSERMGEAVAMDIDEHLSSLEISKQQQEVEVEPLANVLRRFLAVQENRAHIYTRLKRGFQEYLRTGSERAYQQLCTQITGEFNDCSKQVIEMESTLGSSYYCREDLVNLLKTVQENEKQKLHMTATIQVLKKAGRPSERAAKYDLSQIKERPSEPQCSHVHHSKEFNVLEISSADAEYDAALNEAIRAVQEAVTCINEQMEVIRYEIEELEEEKSKETNS